MDAPHDGSRIEEAFEDAIEAHLLEHGCGRKGDGTRTYDRDLGLDTDELFAFIGATQVEAGRSLSRATAATQRSAQRKFASGCRRRARPAGHRRRAAPRRQGPWASTIQLAYFRPAHGLTPSCVAALRGQPAAPSPASSRTRPTTTKTLDLALFVNGLPVATAELKNQLTGQTVEHAKKQYRDGPRPAATGLLSQRAVVHFAVDPDLVVHDDPARRAADALPAVQPGPRTATAAPATRPTPDGSPHGVPVGGGLAARRLARPPRAASSTSSSRAEGAGKADAARVIFPRYHQWDAVRALDAHAARARRRAQLPRPALGRVGQVEHDRLARRTGSRRLHDADDDKVFDKVVVITDRRRARPAAAGHDLPVRPHARRGRPDRQALARSSPRRWPASSAQIIITTLQKFPFVLDQVAGADGRPLRGDRRRGALLADRRGGQGPQGGARRRRPSRGAARRRRRRGATPRARRDDPQDALAARVAARGRQANLSFFAFTATPKAKTLELFGTSRRRRRRMRPFHLYSMRQAIEEGFILDVLRNYTTYTTYWPARRTAAADDPEVDKAKAAARTRPVRRRCTRTNLAQKAEIIVEHFRAHTRHKIGGTAKAMVVTARRLHAVRYKQAIDAYIARQGLHRRCARSSRSPAGHDRRRRRASTYTEPRMNGFPERADCRAVRRPTTYQVLIVAEKYQTGFDQPLLHTMYVDKKLDGVNAVQTLSRLNRIHPGKTTRSSWTSSTTPRTSRTRSSRSTRRPSPSRPTRTLLYAMRRSSTATR